MKKLNLQLFANGSIVDYLKEQKQDSSYAARAKLAEENGIENYTGSAEQNTKLLSILQGNSSATTSSNAVTTSASGTSNTSTQLPVTGDGTQLAQSALSKTFTPSASYQSAMDYTNELLQQLSSGRTSYTDQIKSMMDQIMNREDFEYDADSDMLFQQYLASSMATGKQAMQDTMGQAAALTGGYGSTYATSAGNQMYNAYIQDAYNNLPEYYQLALDAYNMEGQEMYNQLAMLNEADATEYGRIYNAWNANNTYAQQLYQQEYGEYSDEVNNAFNLAQFVNSNYWNEKQYIAQLAKAGGDSTDYDALTEAQIKTLQNVWNNAENEDVAMQRIESYLSAWGKDNVDYNSLMGVIDDYEPTNYSQLSNTDITKLEEVYLSAGGGESGMLAVDNQLTLIGKNNLSDETDTQLRERLEKLELKNQNWKISDDTYNAGFLWTPLWAGVDHNDMYTYGDETLSYDQLVERAKESNMTDEEYVAFIKFLKEQSVK